MPPVAPRPEPLSPERFKVTFTASPALRDKLERLQALTGEDFAAVIEAAVTEKLERLDAKRYAQTKRPRKSLAEVDRSGRRCKERHGLEFHHRDPFARGGTHEPDTIRLMCTVHNALMAERDYGKEKMDRYRRRATRISERAPKYGLAEGRARTRAGQRSTYRIIT